MAVEIDADRNRPGFPARFWIGQVPLGQTINKEQPNGWGDRVQVRIIGTDPKEGNVLDDLDLKWATILKPSSHGNLNRGSTAIVGGEWVVGMFVSGPPQYEAVIIGVLGRSDATFQLTQFDEQNLRSTEFKTVSPYTYLNPATSLQTAGSGRPLPSPNNGLNDLPEITSSDWGANDLSGSNSDIA